jgi:hypothetical protein
LSPYNLIHLSLSDNCPANIGIDAAPPLLSLTLLPYDYIAIDITTVPANYGAILHALFNSEQATNHLHKLHHVEIQGKVCNKCVEASYLKLSQIQLLLFTFNIFTAPGYFAPQFFFLPTSTQVPPGPRPPWTKHFLGSHLKCTPHPNAFIAFKFACS